MNRGPGPLPDIEITPEMLQAGAAVLAECYEAEIADWLAEGRARRVFEAMIRAANSSRFSV